eukprot:UN13480
MSKINKNSCINHGRFIQFLTFFKWYFHSFSEGYEVLILRFHLYPAHSFKDEKFEHLS